MGTTLKGLPEINQAMSWNDVLFRRMDNGWLVLGDAAQMDKEPQVRVFEDTPESEGYDRGEEQQESLCRALREVFHPYLADGDDVGLRIVFGPDLGKDYDDGPVGGYLGGILEDEASADATEADFDGEGAHDMGLGFGADPDQPSPRPEYPGMQAALLERIEHLQAGLLNARQQVLMCNMAIHGGDIPAIQQGHPHWSEALQGIRDLKGHPDLPTLHQYRVLEEQAKDLRERVSRTDKMLAACLWAVEGRDDSTITPDNEQWSPVLNGIRNLRKDNAMLRGRLRPECDEKALLESVLFALMGNAVHPEVEGSPRWSEAYEAAVRVRAAMTVLFDAAPGPTQVWAQQILKGESVYIVDPNNKPEDCTTFNPDYRLPKGSVEEQDPSIGIDIHSPVPEPGPAQQTSGLVIGPHTVIDPDDPSTVPADLGDPGPRPT